MAFVTEITLYKLYNIVGGRDFSSEGGGGIRITDYGDNMRRNSL